MLLPTCLVRPSQQLSFVAWMPTYILRIHSCMVTLIGTMLSCHRTKKINLKFKMVSYFFTNDCTTNSGHNDCTTNSPSHYFLRSLAFVPFKASLKFSNNVLTSLHAIILHCCLFIWNSASHTSWFLHGTETPNEQNKINTHFVTVA